MLYNTNKKEVIYLKKIITAIVAIAFFATFSTLSFAESVELAGVVKAIETEKIIITDTEGNNVEFEITDETVISEDVIVGAKVFVEAEDGKALYVDFVIED